MSQSAMSTADIAEPTTLPEVLDAAGILADDLLADVVEGTEDRLGPAVDAALADAGDAGVGVDNAEDEASPARLDGERLDAGDLHEKSPPTVGQIPETVA